MCTEAIIVGRGNHYYTPVHVELALRIALINCAIRGCTPYTIDFSRGFWYMVPLPRHIMFEDAKLLAALMSAVQWCKSHAHISFQSKVIEFFIRTNST